MTGVTNCGSSFTAAYSYMKSESARAWQWFIEQCAGVHWPEAQPPKVVVADLGEGLRTAHPNSKLSTATLQFCQWHAFQAIRKKINAGARSGRGYNKKRRIRIKDRIWAYLQAATKEELDHRREALLREMTLDHQAYLTKYYAPLEEYLISYHVRKLPNLGAYSTQRGESSNQAVKNFTRATMGMRKSLTAIKRYTQERCDTILSTETDSFTKGAMYVTQMQKDIKDGEPPFGRCATLGIGTQAFEDIKLLFTRYALVYTAKQYRKALELWFLPHTHKDRAYCECTSLVRFGLPCEHKLL